MILLSANRAFRLVHRAADSMRGPVRVVLVRAARDAQQAVSLAALADAANAVERAMTVLQPALVQMEDVLYDEYRDVLVRVLQKGADAAVDSRGKIRTLRKIKSTFKFNILDPNVVRWATEHTAELVKDISVGSRVALRSSLMRAIYTERMAPARTAKMIRSMIGLDERGVTAVYNFRQRLLASGISPSVADARAATYTQQLINKRALKIARTETLAAANEGQRQTWRQGIAKGVLPRTAKREWIATDNACPLICAPLDGKRVGIDESFGVPGPPAHPNCRCAHALVV